MKKLLFALLPIAIIGCQKEQQTSDNTIFLTEDNMPAPDTLYLEKVDLNEKILEAYTYVYDGLYLSINYKAPDPYFVTVTDKNNNVVAEYYKKGEGPNEFVGIGSQLHNNFLHIYDPTVNRIARMDIDSIVLQKYDYHPQITTIRPNLTRGYAYTSDSTITAFNVWFLDGYNIDPNVPEYIRINTATGKCDSTSINSTYFTCGVTGGQLMYNTETKTYIMTYNRKPQIDILDENLNLIKSYVGPEPNDIEFETSYGNNLHETKGNVSYFHEASTMSQNNFFVRNARIYKTQRSEYHKNSQQLYSENQEIWRFNKTGDFINRYKFPNAMGELFAPSYCEETKTLYVNGYDEDGELGLYKCTLK
ncbi:MAG: hypothetical protein J6Y72_10850 [Bacteroidales bacterium]|nr:hypothetical protein [Bacteroidales bacterium]